MSAWGAVFVTLALGGICAAIMPRGKCSRPLTYLLSCIFLLVLLSPLLSAIDSFSFSQLPSDGNMGTSGETDAGEVLSDALEASLADVIEQECGVRAERVELGGVFIGETELRTVDVYLPSGTTEYVRTRVERYLMTVYSWEVGVYVNE